MKKIALLIAVAFSTQLSFASDAPSTSSSATSSFKKEFNKASEVQWQHSETYDKVSFMLDSRFMNAYYTAEGELMAVTRNIASDQLPLKLLMALKKDYSDFWISELFEVVNGSGDCYYVTLENGDEKLVLKAKSHKGWKLYNKIAK